MGSLLSQAKVAILTDFTASLQMFNKLERLEPLVPIRFEVLYTTLSLYPCYIQPLPLPTTLKKMIYSDTPGSRKCPLLRLLLRDWDWQ